jgi:hypothetical protein
LSSRHDTEMEVAVGAAAEELAELDEGAMSTLEEVRVAEL